MIYCESVVVLKVEVLCDMVGALDAVTAKFRMTRNRPRPSNHHDACQYLSPDVSTCFNILTSDMVGESDPAKHLKSGQKPGTGQSR